MNRLTRLSALVHRPLGLVRRPRTEETIHVQTFCRLALCGGRRLRIGLRGPCEFWDFISSATMATGALACVAACCCSKIRIARSPGVAYIGNGSGGIAEAQTEARRLSTDPPPRFCA